MRVHIESFKRLYKNNKLSLEALQERLNNGKITKEEYDYIVNE